MRTLLVLSIIIGFATHTGKAQNVCDTTLRFFRTEQNPRCEGGLSEITSIFSDLQSDYPAIMKLNSMDILIDCNGYVTIDRSEPKLTGNTEKFVEQQLNSIEWIPAYQRRFPVTVQAKLQFTHLNNSIGITCNYDLIESIPRTVVSGRVFDSENNLPVPGVSITCLDNHQSTVTDDSGGFKLYFDTDYVNATIDVQHVIYKEIKFQMPNSKIIRVTLEKHYIDLGIFNFQEFSPNKLPYNSTCSPEEFAKSSFKVISNSPFASYPVDNSCFVNYLCKNFSYPEQAYKANYSGTVEISMVIDKSGKANDISVTGDDDYGIKAEFVSLLTKMPSWNPAHQNHTLFPQNIKFSVIFGENKYWKKKFRN